MQKNRHTSFKFITYILVLLVIQGCNQAANTPQNKIKSSEPPQLPPSAITEKITPVVPTQITEIKMKDLAKSTSNCTVFEDFSNNQVTAQWFMVNDGVMGGRSQGQYKVENGAMSIKGNINTNGGGFSSIRSTLPSQILDNAQSVKITALSDGRNYQVTFRDTINPQLSYRTALLISDNDQWQTVSLNLEDLMPAFFGRLVQAEPFNKNKAVEIGFILSDGQDGPFELQIKTIEFCPTKTQTT